MKYNNVDITYLKVTAYRKIDFFKISLQKAHTFSLPFISNVFTYVTAQGRALTALANKEWQVHEVECVYIMMVNKNLTYETNLVLSKKADLELD